MIIFLILIVVFAYCYKEYLYLKKEKVIRRKVKKKKEELNYIISQVKTDDFKDIYFDIKINDIYSGRIVMHLFDNVVPKTCKNFRALCKTKYKGTRFHRIVKDFVNVKINSCFSF